MLLCRGNNSLGVSLNPDLPFSNFPGEVSLKQNYNFINYLKPIR